MKRLLFITAIATAALSVAASTPESADKSKLFSLREGWYVDAGVGIQTIFSKDGNQLSFGKRLTPAYSLTAGKWLTPVYGVRLQAQGYAFNGFSTADGLYVNNPLTNGNIYGNYDPITDHVTVNSNGSYRHYLRYLNLHVDVQVSLLNLIWGVRPERRIDVLPAVGIGYAHAFSYRGSAKTNALTANFSIMAKYRILDYLDGNFELSSALLPDHFDGRISGRKYEPTLSASLGVTYRFGACKRKCNIVDAPTPYVEPAPEPKPAIVRDTVTIIKYIDRPVEHPVNTSLVGKTFTLTSVHFDLGKTTPRKGQETTFLNVVKFLNENPQARIRLDGYADKDTGSDRQNMRLSMQRSSEVLEILMYDYGIPRSRIEVQGLGNNAQPYEENDLNRVVVITAIAE